MEVQISSSTKSFAGKQLICNFESKELGSKTSFSVYLPPTLDESKEKFPVVFWLSGLTCTEKNFIEKSGFQRFAAQHKLIVVGPDTSPKEIKELPYQGFKGLAPPDIISAWSHLCTYTPPPTQLPGGLNIEGEDDSWDFGSGAGFYVDATADRWKKYRIMGGHGALICALKNPGLYKTVSAFAPIANPINCPWGQKAFSGYFGENNKEEWKNWDATELVKNYNGPPIEILVDQGKSDQFLEQGQLLPDNFVRACVAAKVPIVYRLQDGYDHSYYFIATFIADHFAHHAKQLKA
ncbi:hypothetical protein QYM36_005417 [Artemia franciscana]|uniref:S-formylglutathione hydrolase n=1 Tax=Artemia franciscana TaxID=6661 RepID=A0AA88LFR2_ARTSF|nr:hypothetical protein QYM36_005417 [Artemia franciscana]